MTQAHSPARSGATLDDLDWLAASAAEAASMLKLIAHEGRLLVLCHLAKDGEMSAGALTGRVGLSQSALSQHLAKLRDQGLVDTRRDGQSVFYRIGDPRTARILETLKDVFCP